MGAVARIANACMLSEAVLLADMGIPPSPLMSALEASLPHVAPRVVSQNLCGPLIDGGSESAGAASR